MPRASFGGLRTLLAVALSITTGCGTIRESVRNDDQEIRRYSEEQVSTDWQLGAAVDATPTDSGADLKIRVQRYKTCSTTEHRVVDRTEVTERTWDSQASNNRQTSYFWGVVGLAAAIGGGYLAATASDANSSDSQGPLEGNNGRVAGYGLVGVGSALVVAPFVNEGRATDSSEHVGTVDEAKPSKTRVCQSAAASGVPVALRGERDVLAEATTDSEGIAVVHVTTEQVLRGGPRYRVTVDGRAAGDTTALAGFYSSQRTLHAKQAAAKVLEEEATTGRCTDARAATMGQVLQGVRNIFDGSSDSYYEIVDHKLAVASTSGTTLAITPLLAGEIHVLAFHYDRGLQLEVRDQDGYPVSNESPYGDSIGQMFMQDVGWSTRALQARAGAPITMTLKGEGCALLVAVRRW